MMFAVDRDAVEGDGDALAIRRFFSVCPLILNPNPIGARAGAGSAFSFLQFSSLP